MKKQIYQFAVVVESESVEAISSFIAKLAAEIQNGDKTGIGCDFATEKKIEVLYDFHLSSQENFSKSVSLAAFASEIIGEVERLQKPGSA